MFLQENMGILLFWVSAVFSLLFFLFSKQKTDSFFWTPLVETLFFLLLGISFFFFFSWFWHEKKERLSSLNIKSIKSLVASFFQKYLYYIGFILFYLAVYFILQSFWVREFSPFIFTANILVLFFFFLSNKFFILQDFIKVNTILFSLFYIYAYLWFFVFRENYFTTIDILNTGVLTCTFFITLGFEKKFLKKQHLDTTLLAYFALYGLLSLVFYFSYTFDSLSFIFSFVGIGGCILLFILSENLDSLKKSKKVLKTIGLSLLYFGNIAGIYHLFFIDFSAFIFSLLFIAGVFNFLVHKNYQNYSSFTLSFCTFFALCITLFFEILPSTEQAALPILVFFWGASFCIIFFTYFFHQKYYYDYYFLHVFSYIVNLFWVFSFFYFWGFDILVLGGILLGDSLFVFLSYYKLNSLQKISSDLKQYETS